MFKHLVRFRFLVDEQFIREQSLVEREITLDVNGVTTPPIYIPIHAPEIDPVKIDEGSTITMVYREKRLDGTFLPLSRPAVYVAKPIPIPPAATIGPVSIIEE